MTAPSSKKSSRHFHPSDIRGLTQLVVQATRGVTGIVEGVHRSVFDTLGIPGSKTPGLTRGITGLVYRSVHGATQFLGNGADTALTGLQVPFESLAQTRPGSPERERILAALNGMLGDRLLAANSPFTAVMTFHDREKALIDLDLPSMPAATGKVLLLIHGLCMNDLQWRDDRDNGRLGQGHGEALASQLAYTPVYLRYNSGLHISHNGNELAARLEQLLAHWPVPIEELTIVAHSMGGLVARSAVHAASKEAMSWPGRLKNIVFLGTPHHGAPLERGGNWLDLLLGSTPWTRPFTALGRLRSAGVTDLRYGHVRDEDWQGRDRFQRLPDQRLPVPLPGGVASYTVAASMGSGQSPLSKQLAGDGLVPVNSALGEHSDPRHKLLFPPSYQWIARETNHLQLLSSPGVTRQILQWLTPYRRTNEEMGSEEIGID